MVQIVGQIVSKRIEVFYNLRERRLVMPHQQAFYIFRYKHFRRGYSNGFHHSRIQTAALPADARPFPVDRYILTGKPANQHIHILRQFIYGIPDVSTANVRVYVAAVGSASRFIDLVCPNYVERMLLILSAKIRKPPRNPKSIPPHPENRETTEYSSACVAISDTCL